MLSPLTLEQHRIRLAAAIKAGAAAKSDAEKEQARLKLQRARYALNAAVRNAEPDIIADPGDLADEEDE